MATQLFYKMLIEKTAVDCDQDHLNTIIPVSYTHLDVYKRQP